MVVSLYAVFQSMIVEKEKEPSAKERLLSGNVKATFRAQVLHILNTEVILLRTCGRIYKTSSPLILTTKL